MSIIIPAFENLYLSLYLMAEIVIHPYTKWQKSRPIPIRELKNCEPSERHLRTRHFLRVNPPPPPPGSSFNIDNIIALLSVSNYLTLFIYFRNPSTKHIFVSLKICRDIIETK